MKKMILTLISLTDPCTEVFCTSFLFYINMFNISNLNKKCLIAETKMNFVSWALKALKYSFDVDSIVFHWNDFLIGFVPIVSTFY